MGPASCARLESLLAAAAATVAFAFTPIALAEPAVFFGCAFANGAGVALMGNAMAILSLLDGSRAPKGTKRRGAAMTLCIIGIVFCIGAIVTLAVLWLWLPEVVAYTPLWSSADQ